MANEVHSLVTREAAHAARATLYTVGLDGVRTLCARWPGPFADLAELVEQVEERALRQANTLGGVHNFMFELHDASGQPIGCEVFRVGAENFGDSSRSMLSEPANEGGLVAQLMRHNEAIMHGHTKGFQQTTATLLKDREITARRAEFVEEKYMKGLELFMSAVMGERAHEIELLKANANAQVKGELVKRVAGLIPEVLASFVSGKTGQAANGAAIAAKGLFSTLTQDQMQAILGALDQGQQLQLIGLMKRLAAEAEGKPQPQHGGGANGAH